MISIITAATRENLMDRVWNSVRKQTYMRWEWIIVCDGSDGVRKWYISALKKAIFAENVWMVDIERKTGNFGGWARNIGVMASKSPYIVFLDDDNEWYPDHLETLVAGLSEHPESSMVCVDAEIRGKKNRNYRHIRKCAIAPQNIDLGQVLYRRELFYKYGFFYPRAEKQITFDFELIEKMADGEGEKRVYIIHKPTFIFYHRRR